MLKFLNRIVCLFHLVDKTVNQNDQSRMKIVLILKIPPAAFNSSNGGVTGDQCVIPICDPPVHLNSEDVKYVEI